MKLILIGQAVCMVQYSLQSRKVLVTGHRGSPANTPEHTIHSYTLAIEQGADYIEPDLVITMDKILVSRHENDITGTTDVSTKPEFHNRKTTKTIDGLNITGWFTEDFTLAELKTLRCLERIPLVRPNNTKDNGKYQIPTFQEIIALVQAKSLELDRIIGIYPETKHPTYFRSIGKPLEDILIPQLYSNGYQSRSDPVMIQSFEVSNLKTLRKSTDFFLTQLVDSAGNRPYDFVVDGDKRKSEDLVTLQGLREIATYADAVSPYKYYIINRDEKNEMGKPTELTKNAHAVGLQVHTWTLRVENMFLPDSLKVDPKNDSTLRGNGIGEMKEYILAGVDAFFTDSPDYGRFAVDTFALMY